MIKQNVRVDDTLRKRVKRVVSKTKQSIGGFYDLAVKEKLEKESATIRYSKYLVREPTVIIKLVCHHPKDVKVWEWGGLALNSTSEFVHKTTVLYYENGKEVREDFDIKDNDYSKVAEYIDSIK